MKNIKKYIMSLVAVVAMALGFALATPIASANVYLSNTVCTHSTYSKFICFDVSAQQVTIKTGGTVTTYAAGSTMTPTKGWLAYDVYECNAAAPAFDTSFVTTGSYGLPANVQYVTGAVPPTAGNINVSQSLHDTIAYIANSQTGYACLLVP